MALLLGSVPPPIVEDISISNYWPIEQGAEWAQDCKLTFPGGQTKTWIARCKIDGTQAYNGKMWSKLRSLPDDPSEVRQTTLIRIDASGVYIVNLGETPAVEKKQLDRPMKVGSIWLESSAKNATKGSVVGLEDVTVNGTIYTRCLHIRFTESNGDTQDDWQAPNVGCVKEQIVHPEGKVAVTLREFKPGKK